LLALGCTSGDQSDGNAVDTLAQAGTAQVAFTEPETCAYAPPRPSFSPGRIVSNGAERRYLLHMPAGFPRSYDGFAPAPAPLLIVLHGAGVSAQTVIELTAIADAADRRGMIAVFPEGLDHTWNALGASASTSDTEFVAGLIGELSASLCIDVARVYIAGFSLGGSMAQRVACSRPDLIAAAAIVAAPMAACQGDVPIVAIHGDADPIAPYKGRPSMQPGGVSLPPIEQAISDWARALGCGAAPALSRPAPDVEVAAYSGCHRGDTSTVLYTVLGGGHTWPGATFDFPPEVAGRTTHSISANELLLDFFESHRR
jgi:polyhydroxybutyrate depolymerase